MAEQALETTITNPELAGELMRGADAAPKAERVLPDPRPADKHGWWWGTGRRKTAVARVRLRPAKNGQGKIQIQSTHKKFKDVEEYFSELRDRKDATAALTLTDTMGALEVVVRLTGGGYMGQAQALRLGIARALVGYDPNFEPALRDAGYLTRDARKVERKKYGQPGARKRFQFSKR
jgi:small subunit ribosomal protein S9